MRGRRGGMVRQEVRRLGSRHRDQSLMYPGERVFTWVRVAGVWFLAAIERGDTLHGAAGTGLGIGHLEPRP